MNKVRFPNSSPGCKTESEQWQEKHPPIMTGNSLEATVTKKTWIRLKATERSHLGVSGPSEACLGSHSWWKRAVWRLPSHTNTLNSSYSAFHRKDRMIFLICLHRQHYKFKNLKQRRILNTGNGGTPNIQGRRRYTWHTEYKGEMHLTYRV